MPTLADLVRFMDDELQTSSIPDYDGAVNGLQLGNDGSATRVAAAVDFSLPAVQRAKELGADLLLTHHGMFWGGAQPIVHVTYERLRLAMDSNLAVYASHIPLDLHPELGNNALLARELGLAVDGAFGRFRDVHVGVAGGAAILTDELLGRVRGFSERYATHVVCTPFDTRRRTKRWGILTGAGASTATLAEARAAGIDTLIVGEGPHHTGVEAREHGMVVMYAGHYATETLGVQALARRLEERYALPWSFVAAPTGL